MITQREMRHLTEALLELEYAMLTLARISSTLNWVESRAMEEFLIDHFQYVDDSLATAQIYLREAQNT